jgi:hypothetical protein
MFALVAPRKPLECAALTLVTGCSALEGVRRRGGIKETLVATTRAAVGVAAH